MIASRVRPISTLTILALAMTLIQMEATAVGQKGLDPTNSCLAFVSENLARGRNNFFTYYQFSDTRVRVRDGDVLEYQILLDPKNPVAKGGIDARFDDSGDPLRDLHLRDEKGIDSHGDGLITPAIGHWYSRRIPLLKQAGRLTTGWYVDFEGDEFGRYAQWIDHVRIAHADGTETVIYDGGVPNSRALDSAEGYTKFPTCLAVRRDTVHPGADFDQLVTSIENQGKKLAHLETARKDINLAKQFLQKSPDAAAEGHVKVASALLDAVEQKDATPEEVEAVLHEAQHALSHTHPVMEKYTGHLVGHAHIDLQWLWEWQEGLVFSRDTFTQAVKFMDEFPGFTFSQSSSFLYRAIEDQYPELFDKMKTKVKAGQWELVGGRICEGDTNMISPESHARQFLYGQSYFREKFGKTAVVGWEPDTFGHTAQMPQIAKLGGLSSYYFCRGGKGKPLFWWQALDGTKLLTFDEPASGSWYNSDLSYRQFKEMLDFQGNTGSKDMLWVYGVGNHGGGPTREMIEVALGWMKDPSKPKVKFSTATQFFDKLRTYDLQKVPTYQTELNPVFEGCYTTHSEIKQANRLAEATTTSAEAIATIASIRGFKYPRAAFRRNWEDICYNHHHDTLPGSGIHPPYEKTKVQLARVVLDDQEIIQRAMESVAVQVTAPPEPSEMVFNPTGWKRSGWVEMYAVHSGFDSQADRDANHLAAVGPDGTAFPVQILNRTTRRIRFWAGDVPAYGYKVFRLKTVDLSAPRVVQNGDQFETDRYRVRFDFAKGEIASLFDKRQNRELAGNGLGRLEAHFEGLEGMSAWVLGRIEKVVPLEVLGHQVQKDGQQMLVTIQYRLGSHNSLSEDSIVTQKFHLDPQTGDIRTDVDCDWHVVGSGHEPTPMLRAVFDSALDHPTARYEVPFGSITRKADGAEGVALQWGDISDGKGGLSIFNDSKHGYSTEGAQIRLTLIRSPHDPDPDPNPGHHHWQYAIHPHPLNEGSAALSKYATELNQPLYVISVPYDARGDAPLQWSALSLTDPNVVPTCLKRSEIGDDLIVRAYEASGKPSNGFLLPKIPFGLPTIVNFLEDKLSNTISVPGSGISLKLRPFEIRTIRIPPPN